MSKQLSNSFKHSPLAIAATCLFAIYFATMACFAGADISVTPGNVLSSGPANGATIITGVAGQPITAGQYVYKASSGSYTLLSATSAIPALSGTVGCALNTGSAGQPISVCTSDSNFMPGSGTFNRGDILCASGSNPGAPTLSTNIVAGENVIVLGVATSGSTVNFHPVLSGGANTGTYP